MHYTFTWKVEINNVKSTYFYITTKLTSRLGGGFGERSLPSHGYWLHEWDYKGYETMGF